MRTQIKFAFLVSVTLIAGQAGAQESIPTFDSARLERLDAYIQGAIDRKEIPGAVVVVTDRDGVVHHAAMGSADIDTGRPMTEDSIFRIASMTKAITTTAALMLHDEGKLNVNDPVRKYIPEVGKAKVFHDGEPKPAAAGADETFELRLPASRPRFECGLGIWLPALVESLATPCTTRRRSGAWCHRRYRPPTTYERSSLVW